MCAEQNVVMKSHGITEQEMNALMVQLRRALAAREGSMFFGAS